MWRKSLQGHSMIQCNGGNVGKHSSRNGFQLMADCASGVMNGWDTWYTTQSCLRLIIFPTRTLPSTMTCWNMSASHATTERRDISSIGKRGRGAAYLMMMGIQSKLSDNSGKKFSLTLPPSDACGPERISPSPNIKFYG